MKDSISKQLLKSLVVVLGTVVCGLGVQLELFSGAGVDPLTMFEEGLGKTISTPTGTIALWLNIAMLLLALVLNRKNIWVGSIITVLLLGPSINFFAGLMAQAGMVPPASWPVKILLSVLGVFLTGLGIAVYMLPNYGVGAMEAVMIFFSEKLHIPYGAARIGMDCTWGVIGFFLGGTLGVGTLIGAFGIGTSLDLCYRALCKVFSVKKAG